MLSKNNLRMPGSTTATRAICVLCYKWKRLRAPAAGDHTYFNFQMNLTIVRKMPSSTNPNTLASNLAIPSLLSCTLSG